MSISSTQYYRAFLLIAVGFYLGFFRFIERVITGAGNSGTFESVAEGNVWNQLIGGLLLIMTLFHFLHHKLATLIPFLRQAWPCLLIIFLFFISISWSDVPNITLRRSVAFLILILVAFTLSEVFTARSLLNFLANGIALVAFVGLIYTLASGNTLSFGLGDRDSGFRGMFADKNSAARVYAYGFLILVALGRYKANVDKAIISLLILALASSQSASAVVIALMGLSLLIALRLSIGKTSSQSLWRFLVLLLLLSIAGVMILYLYEYLLTLLGRDANLTNRAIVWELLAPYMEDKRIIGYGFGSFWASNAVGDFIERWGFIGNAHSGYLEMMLHAGLVGLSLLIIFLFVSITRSSKLYILTKHKLVASFAITLFTVQIIANYIGYIILNHNSFDMFLFMVCFFYVSKLHMSKESTDK